MNQRFKDLAIPSLFGIMGVLVPVLIIEHATSHTGGPITPYIVLASNLLGFGHGAYTVAKRAEKECKGEQL